MARAAKGKGKGKGKAKPSTKGAKPKAITRKPAKALTMDDPGETPQTIPVKLDGRSKELAFAELALKGVAGNAMTVKQYAQPWMGELHASECIRALRGELAELEGGDTSNIESMLYGQARALEAVFHAMLNRASINIGALHLEAGERFMRLGLKAQSQCRTTLESLAEIKNPRPVAFVRQANIANGPQQVNNGDARGENANRPNELHEGHYGQPMAPRATTPRLRADTGTATVVEIDRAANPRRKSALQP